MNELEIDVAELLVKHIPSAEMVRFGKNGGDATTIAIKIARAITGNKKLHFVVIMVGMIGLLHQQINLMVYLILIKSWFIALNITI